MDLFSYLIDAPWRLFPAAIVVLLGLEIVWHGLRGGPDGSGGLLRSGVGALARMEGWRTLVAGLAVTGLGAAWIWQSPLLLFLSLGIGFCEIREASTIIAAVKWRRGRVVTNRAHERGAKPRQYQQMSTMVRRDV